MTLLFCFLFCLLLTGCQEPVEEVEPIRPVKTIRVEDPSFIRSRPFPGVVRAESRVNVSFRVSGPLITFPADVGDKVKKGEVMARIDPRDFEIAVAEARASLNRSKAAFVFARNDFERALNVQTEDPGAISESLVDQKREERNRRKAQVELHESQLEGAEDQLRYTYLRAPFGGAVVATYADNFQNVRAKDPIVRLLNTSYIEMVVDIPEHLIPYVSRVSEVNITLDVFPEQTFSAVVKEIGKEASTTTRTYPVTLLMRQPEDREIFAGMSGEARFIGKVTPDDPMASVTVPTSAVFSDQETEKSFVWIIDAETMRVEKREVTIGNLTSYGIEVERGLLPGEQVVIAGVHYLREGQQVRIFE